MRGNQDADVITNANNVLEIQSSDDIGRQTNRTERNRQIPGIRAEMLQAFLVDIVHNRLREGNTADIALLPLFPPYGRICGRVIVADGIAAVVQIELDQLIDYVSHHAQHNDLQLMTDIEGTEYIAKVIGV